jgi:hypothetical protein
VSTLDEVAERDRWRCWLCDEPVDPRMSVNDARGPSVDSRTSDAKAKAGKPSKAGKPAKRGPSPAASGGTGSERLAHRGCNTRKGAVTAVVPWPEQLFIADPAPLIGVAERLERKGGREVVARCPTREDAQATADWLVDRFSRLVPGLPVTATLEPGGGQFMVALAAPR